MQTRGYLASLCLAFVACVFASMTAIPSFAQSETVLYNFVGTGNFSVPNLVSDSSGNLYGAIPNNDTKIAQVFELSPAAGGGWTRTVLHNLAPAENAYEIVSNVIFDTAGNLYGTTSEGGAGCGTVYELQPGSGGTWSAKQLHSFSNNSIDGCTPLAGLVIDAAGNLYGTTQMGGHHGTGTVFKLTPRSVGPWGEEILHNFGYYFDGEYPQAELTLDSAGNLYGTTNSGGAIEAGYGTVFELSPHAGASWTETILYNFTTANGANGSNPLGGVIFDAAGNLYGTTDYGSADGFGTAYELSPVVGGGWTLTLLHSYGNTGDGSFPQGNLVLDATGNLYGTTYAGGVGFNGTVYKLKRSGSAWNETILFSFDGTDGQGPASGLILDGTGNLYGMTSADGPSGGGVAFEITP
ncbi:MAG: choice-of-anchor tandem repeat GloVer-containing protein [Candidatus Sulfotelmatobacter sp.]